MLHRIPRLKHRILAVLFVLVVISFFLIPFSNIQYDTVNVFNQKEEPQAPRPIVGNIKPKESQEFWTKVFDIIENNKIELENLPEAIKYTDKKDRIEGPNTKESLLSRAIISDEVFNELKKKHEKILQELPSKISTSTYKKGSTGVVMVGGGKFSWLSYLSIKSLRDTGSNLPVEVVMPSFKDYEAEKEYCNKILPELHASCVLIPDVLGPQVMLKWGSNIKSYQFKSLALMASSFENILLLDSDNIIVTNPSAVFESDLYSKNGMITWPDFWKRTISPKYYDIAGLKVNERKRVRYDRFPLQVSKETETGISEEELKNTPFHDLEGAISDLSTESGQMIINKRTHGKTLLLSLYYNIFGPNLFYKLFSLGEQGEGDKDTFVTAAEVTKQPYYQVKAFIAAMGYLDSDSKFQGVAMGQKDPLVDYKAFQDNVLTYFRENGKQMAIADQIKYLDKVKEEVFQSRNDFPLFTVHCNYPKLDPILLKGTDSLYDKENERLKYRMFGNLKFPKFTAGAENTEKTEIDFELAQWTHINSALCEKKQTFVHFKDANMEELCKFIENQVKWLSTPI